MKRRKDICGNCPEATAPYGTNCFLMLKERNLAAYKLDRLPDAGAVPGRCPRWLEYVVLSQDPALMQNNEKTP